MLYVLHGPYCVCFHEHESLVANKHLLKDSSIPVQRVCRLASNEVKVHQTEMLPLQLGLEMQVEDMTKSAT